MIVNNETEISSGGKVQHVVNFKSFPDTKGVIRLSVVVFLLHAYNFSEFLRRKQERKEKNRNRERKEEEKRDFSRFCRIPKITIPQITSELAAFDRTHHRRNFLESCYR